MSSKPEKEKRRCLVDLNHGFKSIKGGASRQTLWWSNPFVSVQVEHSSFSTFLFPILIIIIIILCFVLEAICLCSCHTCYCHVRWCFNRLKWLKKNPKLQAKTCTRSFQPAGGRVYPLTTWIRIEGGFTVGLKVLQLLTLSSATQHKHIKTCNCVFILKIIIGGQEC